jgi:hypothetical protein
MNDPNDKKRMWFGHKRIGIGIRPTSWQGWLVIAAGAVAEFASISLAHGLYPSWFIAKTSGYGFNPVCWQGWTACIGPILIWLAVLRYIYFKQLDAK